MDGAIPAIFLMVLCLSAFNLVLLLYAGFHLAFGLKATPTVFNIYLVITGISAITTITSAFFMGTGIGLLPLLANLLILTGWLATLIISYKNADLKLFK